MSGFSNPQSMLESFLTEIISSLRKRNGQRITELIQLDVQSLDSARQKPYSNLNQELNSKFPRGDDSGLVRRCKESISSDEFGSFSTAFSECTIQYFRYLRDFATADNLAKALEIRQLTSQCITALGDSTYGVLMIPIVLSFSRTLAAVATNLDRNPGLLQRSNLPPTQSEGSATGKVSFVEDAANVLRDAFIKCLAGSPGVQRTTRPGADDKRIGIYLTVNSCLKLLFQCRKLRNAQQMFLSIDAQSPPLSFYPAAHRVTYLYYLGRYHFANNHFYRAQLTLQSAYDQCHREALKHRRLILIYLIASNLCLGRFPSSKLLLRREASEIAKKFLPLCKIIKSGDLGAFRRYLDLKNQTSQWFHQKRILLQLQNRCEVLVWRSLIRRTFGICGFHGEERRVPFLRLIFVQHAARWALARQDKLQATSFSPTFGSSVVSLPSNEEYVDPEFIGIDTAVNETGFDLDSGQYDEDSIGHHPTPTQSEEPSPTMYEIESIVLSLVQQGILRGFVLHTNPRFAIRGAKNAGGPMQAGFPPVWSVVDAREDSTVVPGWVKQEQLASNAGGGRVVRLSGARPVGVGS